MQNIVVNMCEKFHNDRLRNDRSSGNGKSDNNKKNKNNNNNNNISSVWIFVSGSKNAGIDGGAMMCCISSCMHQASITS